MKVFISQPMKDRTAEEIEQEREEIMQHLREKYGKGVEEIRGYFSDWEPEGNVPLKCLARSLDMMAEADLVYFAKGWENARGCRIENECAIEYGLDVVEDYRKGDNHGKAETDNKQ